MIRCFLHFLLFRTLVLSIQKEKDNVIFMRWFMSCDWILIFGYRTMLKLLLLAPAVESVRYHLIEAKKNSGLKPFVVNCDGIRTVDVQL